MVAPRHLGEGVVIGVERLRSQQLVPVLEDAGEGDPQRLAAARGGKDVARLKV